MSETIQWFTTAKGSIYLVMQEDKTKRYRRQDNRMDRIERIADALDFIEMPISHKTYFVAFHIALQILLRFENPKSELRYLSFERSTAHIGVRERDKDFVYNIRGDYKDVTTQPILGYIPIEFLDEGNDIHFGNPIIKIETGTKNQFDKFMRALLIK